MIELIYFGKLADAAGKFSEAVNLPETVADTDTLRHWLDQRSNLAGALVSPTVRIALNDEIISGKAPLQDGDRVAFLPPVGGG